MSEAPRPRLRCPPGAADTHMHVYGPYDRWPLWPTSPNAPPEASVAEYRAVQARLGLERVVVVQPAGYGCDNRCTLAAVAEFGARARAVVVVPLGTGDAELERLARAGAVGLRVFLLPGGIFHWEQLPELAAMARAAGWHLQLQCNGWLLAERLDLLERLDVQLVIDHIGRFMDPVPVEHEAFRALQRLVDRGAYVKLSAPYESSRVGPPGWDDVAPLARALVRQAPERMLWATNWPHPGRAPQDEAALLDLLLDWAPDEGVRHRILVENPARLYRFG
ncbi:MAG: amidohydrolase family protein [Geminicoccaceae bacterium]|nr:amidohydrolase family protein [Geminicoccaceae bacterium]MCS7268306.1 amidohydrolase family protein [Geminicoccaceae bacterium]MCX7629193.1 amidohydrolase family protein [Geminicoccaceae bacterium]MDW8125529.1 amidohydrolase family protein [Geminicoccaceae bacterium]MDW8341329.1 amidohydrolase family protein [Geminicoccaceae bacterium]